MKNKIINAIIAVVAIGVILYVSGCIMNADFNLKNWGTDSRTCIGFVFMLISIFAGSMVIIATDEKTN